MVPRNRRYTNPHYDLQRVHAAAAARDIVVTGRAGREALAVLPPDLVDVDGEIREIVVSLARDEFEFQELKKRIVGGRTIHSIVDVYRIDFEGADIWLKIKIEQDGNGEYVVVISFHEWDSSRPI